MNPHASATPGGPQQVHSCGKPGAWQAAPAPAHKPRSAPSQVSPHCDSMEPSPQWEGGHEAQPFVVQASQQLAALPTQA
jgi:hypothetical protein